MALWVCDDCTTVYSVDAPKCPSCGSVKHHEDGAPVPRKTRKPKPSSKG